ncbi:MAG: hypothetical protein NC930_08095, partial [Candidatus Omnitrophica bacterium]|nr:hypothetical protein [Candidatus Omnitrophota bacterium]
VRLKALRGEEIPRYLDRSQLVSEERYFRDVFAGGDAALSRRDLSILQHPDRVDWSKEYLPRVSMILNAYFRGKWKILYDSGHPEFSLLASDVPAVRYMEEWRGHDLGGGLVNLYGWAAWQRAGVDRKSKAGRYFLEQYPFDQFATIPAPGSGRGEELRTIRDSFEILVRSLVEDSDMRRDFFRILSAMLKIGLEDFRYRANFDPEFSGMGDHSEYFRLNYLLALLAESLLGIERDESLEQILEMYRRMTFAYSGMNVILPHRLAVSKKNTANPDTLAWHVIANMPDTVRDLEWYAKEVYHTLAAAKAQGIDFADQIWQACRSRILTRDSRMRSQHSVPLSDRPDGGQRPRAEARESETISIEKIYAEHDRIVAGPATVSRVKQLLAMMKHRQAAAEAIQKEFGKLTPRIFFAELAVWAIRERDGIAKLLPTASDRLDLNSFFSILGEWVHGARNYILEKFSENGQLEAFHGLLDLNRTYWHDDELGQWIEQRLRANQQNSDEEALFRGISIPLPNHGLSSLRSRILREDYLAGEWKLTPAQATVLDGIPLRNLVGRQWLLTDLFRRANRNLYRRFDVLGHPEILRLPLNQDRLERLRRAATHDHFEPQLRMELEQEGIPASRAPLVERLKTPAEFDLWDKEPLAFEKVSELSQREHTKRAGPRGSRQRASAFRQFFTAGGPRPNHPVQRFIMLDKRGIAGSVELFADRAQGIRVSFPIDPKYWHDNDGKAFSRPIWFYAWEAEGTDKRYITVHLHPHAPPGGCAAWNPEIKDFENYQGPVFRDRSSVSQKMFAAWFRDSKARVRTEGEFRVVGDKVPDQRKVVLLPNQPGFPLGYVYSTTFIPGEIIKAETVPVPGEKRVVIHIPKVHTQDGIRPAQDLERYFHETQLLDPEHELVWRFESEWKGHPPNALVTSVRKKDWRLVLSRAGKSDEVGVELKGRITRNGLEVFVIFEERTIDGTERKVLHVYGMNPSVDPKGRFVEFLWSGFWDSQKNEMVEFPDFVPHRLVGQERYEVQREAWRLEYSPRPDLPDMIDSDIVYAILEELQKGPRTEGQVLHQVVKRGASNLDVRRIFRALREINNSFRALILEVGQGRFAKAEHLIFTASKRFKNGYQNEFVHGGRRFALTTPDQWFHREGFAAFEKERPLKLVVFPGKIDISLRRIWDDHGNLMWTGQKSPRTLGPARENFIFTNYVIPQSASVAITTTKGTFRLRGKPGEVVAGIVSGGEILRIDWFPPQTELHLIYQTVRQPDGSQRIVPELVAGLQPSKTARGDEIQQFVRRSEIRFTNRASVERSIEQLIQDIAAEREKVYQEIDQWEPPAMGVMGGAMVPPSHAYYKMGVELG